MAHCSNTDAEPCTARLLPTLLPGLGPRFLGILMGSKSFPGWMLCDTNVEGFWLQGPVIFVFLRPGFRPLWPGGLPTVGVGFIAGVSTLPSVGVPRLFGSTAEPAEIDKHTMYSLNKTPITDMYTRCIWDCLNLVGLLQMMNAKQSDIKVQISSI